MENKSNEDTKTSTSTSTSSTSNGNQDAPEILQQITEGFHSFIDSIFSPTLDNTSNTGSSNNNSKINSPQKPISKQNSFGNLFSSLTGSGSAGTSGIRRSISPPRGDILEQHKEEYSVEEQKLETKRRSLIDQLNSVSFNLDQQKSDDDPITYIKNRLDMAKIKSSLEFELKQIDEILHTESKFDEPIPTAIDQITSFFINSNTTTSTTTNSININTSSGSSSTIVSSNSNVSSSNSVILGIGNSLTSSHDVNLLHNNLHNLTHSSSSSNSNNISTPVSNSTLPGLVIPTETPLNNPDPNKPRFPVRDNIKVKLYVDCDEYFAAAAQAIENANREVFITAWFLSPEVYLIRYPILDSRYRLDNLLKRKAMQGVKIFVILWDETKIATFKGSKRTKDKLEELHQNIKVIKHPPIIPLYWSHHQKTLIVDQEIAFVGGVDFCFGRYDTWSHQLIDTRSQLWPGKDYYNPILGEMGDILSPHGDSIDRLKIPRMPWHDVMVGVNGLAARDVALNFILRWNHHKDDYYLPLYFNTTPLVSNGSVQAQLLRSMDEWSGGGRNEKSIHSAYIQAIEDADHYIYIENQNFVSTHAPGVWNQISFEIIKRIRRAIRKKECFRVYILLPGQQDGKVQEETHIRGLMHWQYSTICKANENSMMSVLKKEFPDIDLLEYICFYSLRTHACLEGNYVSEQIYVHSKLMIVDDRVIIVGSANINDRSLNGERDSELAFIIKNDKDLIDSKMNGKPFKASRSAFNLRLRLWKEHLGLLPTIEYPEILNSNEFDLNLGNQINNSIVKEIPFIIENVNSINQNQNVDIIENNNNNNNNNGMEIDLQKLNTSNSSNKNSISKSHHRSSSFQGLGTIIPGRINSNSNKTSPIESPRNKISASKESSVIIEDYDADIATNLSKSPPNSISLLTISPTTSSNNLSNNNTDNNNNNDNNNTSNNIISQNTSDTNENGLVKINSSSDIVGELTDKDIKFVISQTGSPKPKPRSVSSLHEYTHDSYCASSGVDLTDPICSDFYYGVWVATAASNTRIYDMVFPGIAKNTIKTCEQYQQQSKIPISSSDSRLLSEVRGNLIYHPLDFLADENLQPNFLFTDDLFQ